MTRRLWWRLIGFTRSAREHLGAIPRPTPPWPATAHDRTAMTAVVHVISALTCAGPGRALTTAASVSAAKADLEHVLVSLTPPDPTMVREARERGLIVA